MGALELEQVAHLGLDERLQPLGEILQKRVHAVRRAGHANFGDVRGMVGIAEERSDLSAPLRQAHQQWRIGVLAAAVKGGLKLAPDIIVDEVLHRRNVVRVLEGQEAALLQRIRWVDLQGVDHVLGQAFQLTRGERELRALLVHVLLELEAHVGHLGAQLLELRLARARAPPPPRPATQAAEAVETRCGQRS